MTADVTICIPAYKSAAFVHEAIEGALAQSHCDLKIFISVDPAGDGTEEVCRRYTSDPRVRLSVNPDRKGWVGNVNACLDAVDTPFYVMGFHDDRLHPDFVAKTRAALLANPGAVAAGSYIQNFGARDDVLLSPDITGRPVERAARLFTPTAAYTFKNLLRSDLIRDGLRMWEIPGGGYRADLRVMLAYSLAGNYVVVPEILYSKRYSDTSTVAGWNALDADTLVLAEAESLRSQLDIVARADLDAADKRRLIGLLLSHRPKFDDRFAPLTPGRVAAFERDRLTALLLGLLTPGVLDGAGARDTLSPGYTALMDVRLAAAFEANKDTDAAIHMARRALELEPDNMHALLLLARQRLRQGKVAKKDRVAEAARYVARACEVAPENPASWIMAGVVEHRLGNNETAIAHLRRAIDLGAPDAAALRRMIRRWSGADREP